MIPSLAKFSESLRRLPRSVATRVASEAAPAITALAKASFDASTTPYGVPWAPGDDGERITLRKTGNLERRVQYGAAGTKLRVVLGVPYAKYQIGKRPIFPRQGGALPEKYVFALHNVAIRIIREDMVR